MFTILAFIAMCAAISIIGAMIWHQFSWNDGRCRRCGERLKVYSLDEPIKHEGYYNAECTQCGARYFLFLRLLEHKYAVITYTYGAAMLMIIAILLWSVKDV